MNERIAVMPLLSIKELEQASSIFRGRVGNHMGRSLMHMLDVDGINQLYDRNSHLSGPEFAGSVLRDVGLNYTLSIFSSRSSNPYATLSDMLPDGPFITISNHPCGHLDGISLVDIFGHLRPDYKVMVNDILGRITPLEENFITVTPTGTRRTAPTSASISGIRAALQHLRSGGALGLFPSGAVSDLSMKDMSVRDRKWQEPVLRLIKKAGVPVLPVHFLDGNSDFYYALGLLSWKIRLLRLPAEVFNKKGKEFRICVGPLISPAMLDALPLDDGTLEVFLRSSVYHLI